jgi:putative oxidoreductase
VARDIGLLILRLAGLYLAFGHGWGKLYGLATGQSRFAEGVAAMGFPAPVVFAWAAALAECVGGICVALGLFTRWAAAFAAFAMFVASFIRHRALSHFFSWVGIAPATEESIKAWGNPELAFTYLLIMAAIALVGPGALSVDAKMSRR